MELNKLNDIVIVFIFIVLSILVLYDDVILKIIFLKNRPTDYTQCLEDPAEDGLEGKMGESPPFRITRGTDNYRTTILRMFKHEPFTTAHAKLRHDCPYIM